MIKNRLGVKVTPKAKAEEILYAGVIATANVLYSATPTAGGITSREDELIKVQAEKLVQRIGRLLHQEIGE
jgi:hypothetical protein